MRLSIYKKTSVLFIGASFLAACGGGGGGGGGLALTSPLSSEAIRQAEVRATSEAQAAEVARVLAAASGGTTSGGSSSGGGSTIRTVFGKDIPGRAISDHAVGYDGALNILPVRLAQASVMSLNYNSSGELTQATISATLAGQLYDTFSRQGRFTIATISSDASARGLIIDPTAEDWKYQAFGVWTDTSTASTVFKYGSMSAGSYTAGSSIPRSGSATFNGYGGGVYTDSSDDAYFVQSSVSAAANFATRRVTLSSSGTMKQQYNNNGTVGALSSDSSLNLTGTLSYSANENSIRGNLTAGSMTGPSHVRFYGPNAEEIGGIFNLKDASQTFVGAFGAKR